MPIVVATITPNPGQMDALENALRELAPAVHEEDGCELYALHRGPDRLVFVEKWRDAEALRAHGTGPNTKALGEKMSGLVAGSDIQVLEAVPTGSGPKGAL
jgi:quinol monooxygenase YgiN